MSSWTRRYCSHVPPSWSLGNMQKTPSSSHSRSLLNPIPFPPLCQRRVGPPRPPRPSRRKPHLRLPSKSQIAPPPKRELLLRVTTTKRTRVLPSRLPSASPRRRRETREATAARQTSEATVEKRTRVAIHPVLLPNGSTASAGGGYPARLR